MSSKNLKAWLSTTYALKKNDPVLGCHRGVVESTSNSLLVIAPYRHANTWVFDDSSRGLLQEPFVAGIPELIDKLVA
ncbi:MAG: hypothetical protein KAH99_06910, partial [Verrucomicrobia bacterium]|nr:hypothetical protein [Verrucomicrobiota bacterium]